MPRKVESGNVVVGISLPVPVHAAGKSNAHRKELNFSNYVRDLVLADTPAHASKSKPARRAKMERSAA
jgi:hypothetical protein